MVFYGCKDNNFVQNTRKRKRIKCFFNNCILMFHARGNQFINCDLIVVAQLIYFIYCIMMSWISFFSSLFS